MDQGFNWTDLSANKMPALKFICQQYSISVSGTKKDYINAIANYMRTQNLPQGTQTLAMAANPELQSLIGSRPRRLAEMRHAKAVQKSHENEMKIRPDAFQSGFKYMPPTPPKPEQKLTNIANEREIHEKLMARRPGPVPRRVDFARRSLTSSESSSSSSSPSATMSSSGSRFGSPEAMSAKDRHKHVHGKRWRTSIIVAIIMVLLCFIAIAL